MEVVVVRCGWIQLDAVGCGGSWMTITAVVGCGWMWLAVIGYSPMWLDAVVVECGKMQ